MDDYESRHILPMGPVAVAWARNSSIRARVQGIVEEVLKAKAAQLLKEFENKLFTEELLRVVSARVFCLLREDGRLNNPELEIARMRLRITGVHDVISIHWVDEE